jgi:cell division protein FtsQ
VTESDGVTPDADPAGETTATGPIDAAVPSDGDDDTAAEQETDDAIEGPRRRARRERAERREAQARAMAIEEARREAKRVARGRPAATSKPVGRGTVRGLKLFLLMLLLAVATTGVGLILYFTPVMSARSIIVTGIGAVSRDEVLDVAHVRLGTPLLQINTDGVADRVSAGWPARECSAITRRRFGSSSSSESRWWSKTFPTARICSTATAWTSRPRRHRRRCPTSTSTIPDRPIRRPRLRSRY